MILFMKAQFLIAVEYRKSFYQCIYYLSFHYQKKIPEISYRKSRRRNLALQFNRSNKLVYKPVES